MNQETFEKLLAYLDPDDRDNAANEYVLIEKKLITFFESRQCHLPEEHADITLTRAAKIIDEGRAPDRAYRRSFFYSVAHYVLQEYRDNLKKRIHVSLDNLQSSSQPFVNPEEERLREEEQMESELRSRCLAACMEKLSDKDREIIMEYYQGDTSQKIKNRKWLAERLGISIGALRLKAFRIREGLEKCMKECLERSREA